MLGFLLGLSLLLSRIQAIPTISAKGAKLFTSDGAQFYIKGVAYQLIESDSLVNTAQCQRDAALMANLGANSIRVYHVEVGNDHTGCMSAFEEAGIYVWLDLDTQDNYILPLGSIKPSWTERQYQQYSAVMDEFQAYDNIAGFFIGNEMLTTGESSIAAPYLKAAARDMKAYRDSKGYRDIPIGYSAADIPDLRPNLQNYLACGSNPADAVDFYSLNVYEWCGASSYTMSGYDELEKNATDYNIPIFFSEDGCNTTPRLFSDQSVLFSPLMDNTWSGAIIYQWIEVSNNYGIVSMGGGAAPAGAPSGSSVVDGYTRYGRPTPIQPDFDNLRRQWATLNPAGVAEAAYKPSLTPPPCPGYTKGKWEINGNVPLPTIGETGNYLHKASISLSKSALSASGTPKSPPNQSGTKTAGGPGSASKSAPSSTNSANGPASNDGSRAAGLWSIETFFTDLSNHNPVWFWIICIPMAVLVPAAVFSVYWWLVTRCCVGGVRTRPPPCAAPAASSYPFTT